MAMTASQTSVYVYGVTWADGARGRRGAGVAGGDVETIEEGELAAVVSKVAAGPVRTRRRDLLAHMDVVAEVFASSTVLPFRFGSVFPDRDAVTGMLGARYETLVELLHRYDGMCELRVRGAYREDAILAEIVAGDPRIARLREQTQTAGRAGDALRLELGEAVARSVAARREHDVRALAASLDPLARDIAAEDVRTEFELVRASYLVERRDVPKFDRRMDAFAGDKQSTIMFTYTGPLPPHSFVGLAGA